MDLQTIFYSLGIIFMIVMLTIVGIAAYSLWQIQLKIESLKEQIPAQAKEFIQSKNTELAKGIGLAATTFVLNKVKNYFTKKK